MSIKVMTWVWDNSPAAGTELLALLAIADQTNDEGSNAWPSISNLARRTRLSERTVRRVIQRLADGGHLIVQEGGGRRSNRYSIVMAEPAPKLSTPLTNRPPGQSDTPVTGVTPGVTQLRHPTPDTAVSPDPSYPVLDPSSLGDAKPSRSEVDGGGGFDPATAEVLLRLGPAWKLTPGERRRLASKVASALAAGWSIDLLAEHLAANPDGVKSPFAVLTSRLDDLPAPVRVPQSATERRPWCGECDGEPVAERIVWLDAEQSRWAYCPRCHPKGSQPPNA